MEALSDMGFLLCQRQDTVSSLAIFVEPSFSFTSNKLNRDRDENTWCPGQQAHLRHTFNYLTCEHCFREGPATTQSSMVGNQNSIASAQSPGNFLSDFAVVPRRNILREADFVADHLRLFFDDYGYAFMQAGKGRGKKRMCVDHRSNVRPHDINLTVDFEL